MSCKILWLLHFTFGSALKANHVVMVLIFFSQSSQQYLDLWNAVCYAGFPSYLTSSVWILSSPICLCPLRPKASQASRSLVRFWRVYIALCLPAEPATRFIIQNDNSRMHSLQHCEIYCLFTWFVPHKKLHGIEQVLTREDFEWSSKSLFPTWADVFNPRCWRCHWGEPWKNAPSWRMARVWKTDYD